MEGEGESATAELEGIVEEATVLGRSWTEESRRCRECSDVIGGAEVGTGGGG